MLVFALNSQGEPGGDVGQKYFICSTQLCWYPLMKQISVK